MPRYFFHTFNGEPYPDDEGIELPGLEEARQEAIQSAGKIIGGNGVKSWKGSDWHMAVTDTAGQDVLWLGFAVEVKSGKST